MKKSDLKTGMRITTRSGNIFVVLLNFSHEYDSTTDLLVNPFGKTSWNKLDYYNEDLFSEEYTDDDIIKIEKPEHVYALFNEEWKYETIWERQEVKKVKEMTLTEIEKELGYTVKIINKEDQPNEKETNL